MPARSRKKQRINPPTPSIISSDKHAVFTHWARSQGVEISNVAPASMPGRGIGLITTASVKKGARLIFVPEKAMLQPSASVIESLGLKSASPQAQLAASLTALYQSGVSESYKACSAVWPTPADFESSLLWLPPVPEFIDRARSILPYTLQKPLERVQSDFERDMAVWKPEYDDARERHVYHWTIANTRSFHWKPAGRAKGCMVVCPVLDYMNHCANGQGCEVQQSSKGYSLVANRDYKQGEEILATYGAHTNDKLLVHYGFILPDSSDDGIVLDHAVERHLTPAQRAVLRDVGYMGNFSLTPATNEICFRTQVAIRSALLTANEWEHYMGSGEDLAEDKDKAVRLWLFAPLTEYMLEAVHMERRLQELQKETTEPMVLAKLKLIEARWAEIEAALQDWFKLNTKSD